VSRDIPQETGVVRHRPNCFVIGWLGGNVLKQFRLTIDYPNHTMYWLKQDEPDSHDLNQVGLTLRSDNGAFYVAAIATQHGRATVAGVLAGDKLVRVDDLDLSTATWGQVFAALHGSPGQSRRLILERGGVRRSVSGKVTRF
jgi:C-terminal processing protease CtpA/Prc